MIDPPKPFTFAQFVEEKCRSGVTLEVEQWDDGVVATARFPNGRSVCGVGSTIAPALKDLQLRWVKALENEKSNWIAALPLGNFECIATKSGTT